MVHAETPRVFEYVAAGDRVGLAEYLLGFVQRMKEAGAELAAIPAVTPHYCVRELLAKSAPASLILWTKPNKYSANPTPSPAAT